LRPGDHRVPSASAVAVVAAAAAAVTAAELRACSLARARAHSHSRAVTLTTRPVSSSNAVSSRPQTQPVSSPTASGRIINPSADQ
jgi:hypothetical protein